MKKSTGDTNQGDREWIPAACLLSFLIYLFMSDAVATFVAKDISLMVAAWATALSHL